MPFARLDGVTAGWAVSGWGLGAAVLAALFAGAIPALRAFRLDPMEVLKNAGPKGRLESAKGACCRESTMLQTALTLALLVGAGLLIRTMARKIAEGAVGVQHKSDIDDERDGGAKPGDLGQLSSASAGARCCDSRCAVRGVCLGSPADGKQLAGNARD